MCVMRWLRLGWVVLLVVASCAAPRGRCEAPTVSLPEQVRATPCQPIRLDARTSGKAVRWYAPAGVNLILTADGRTAALSARAPGQYTILAWSAAGDEPGPAAICLLVVEAEQPSGQKPGPASPRGPPAWMIVVEESADRTAQSGRLLGDVEFWQGLRTRGIRYRIYDQDAPEAAQKGYKAVAAENGGLPCLIALDAAGNVLGTGRLPRDADGVLAFVEGL